MVDTGHTHEYTVGWTNRGATMFEVSRVHSDQKISEFVRFLQTRRDANIVGAINLLLQHRKDDKQRKVCINGVCFLTENLAHELSVCHMATAVMMGILVHYDSGYTDVVDKVMAVALMHDLVEDKVGVDFRGAGVSDELVHHVYKLSRNHELYGGYEAMNDIEQVVKCADRLVNLDTCVGVFKREKVAKYVEDTKSMIHAFRNSGTLFGVDLAVLLETKIENMEL